MTYLLSVASCQQPEILSKVAYSATHNELIQSRLEHLTVDAHPSWMLDR